jgi:hypothetical protein
MKRGLFARMLSSAAVALAVATLGVPVSAQRGADHKPSGPVPRASDGKVDLTGVWWLGGEPGVVTAQLRAPTNEPRRPDPPGSTFASLYQPWAAEKAATLSDKDDPSLRCIPSVGGPPNTNIFQLIQTPQWVVLLQETFHGFRLIPTHPGRQHNETQAQAYWGDSVGRWEGDTLVVDVNNFNDRGWISPQGVISFHSDALHVTERYSRIAENTLVVEKTYDDPKVLTRPWVSKKTYMTAPFDQVMEAMCTNTETAALMEAASKVNYGKK